MFEEDLYTFVDLFQYFFSNWGFYMIEFEYLPHRIDKVSGQYCSFHYLVIIFRVRRPWSFIASFLILGICVPGKIAMEKKVDAKNYDAYFD